MIGFGDKIDDRDLMRADAVLRADMASLPTQEGPSQAYWDMYATRVMARVARAERAPVRHRWSLLWKPALSLATIAAAAAAFVLLRPADVSLDQATAALPADDIQVLSQADASMAPTVTADTTVASQLASAADSSVDLDAALAFADADPEQLIAAVHTTAMSSDIDQVQSLSDDDANAVLSSLQVSM